MNMPSDSYIASSPDTKRPSLANDVANKIVELSLIHISSLAGYSVNPYQSSYVATKHAVYGMAQSLRYELEPDNISVQAICPGFVRTPIFTRNGEPEDAIPPQCISVEQAVDEIMAGIEAGDVTINVCNEAREYYKALRNNPEYCDAEMRNLAKFYSLQL